MSKMLAPARELGNSIQIEINGQLYTPSLLDPKKQGTISALNKIAAFYAKEKGYSGLVITIATIGDKGGHDVAFYGNGALTIRSVAFSDGKFDNIYDFKSTLNHEILHWKDPRTVANNYNFMDHANIYLQEASDPEFSKTSESYKINNVNQYIIRILNASQSGMVGMNNAGVIDAFDKYIQANKGGINIYNYFYSVSGITKLNFSISINGVYKPNNEYKYEELKSSRD